MIEVIALILTIYSIYITIRYVKAVNLIKEFQDICNKQMDFIKDILKK